MNKKTHYITILDFASGLVSRIEVLEGMNHEGYEEVIIDRGFKLNDIEWMVHTDPEIYEYD